MIFYAISDCNGRGLYFNFEKQFFGHLEPSCLLPTQHMADTFIEQFLSEDSFVVEVEISM